MLRTLQDKRSMSTAAQASRGRVSVAMPNGWGEAALLCSPIFDRGILHSYDFMNRVLLWKPHRTDGHRCACDIEHSRTNCDDIARILQCESEGFLARWVCTEVVSKILKIPVIQWVKRRGLISAGFKNGEPCILHISGRGDIELLYNFSHRLQAHLAFGRYVR